MPDACESDASTPRQEYTRRLEVRLRSGSTVDPASFAHRADEERLACGVVLQVWLTEKETLLRCSARWRPCRPSCSWSWCGGGNGLTARSACLRFAVEFYEMRLDCLTDHWAGRGEAGLRVSMTLILALDLDLFGPRCLFDLLYALHALGSGHSGGLAARSRDRRHHPLYKGCCRVGGAGLAGRTRRLQPRDAGTERARCSGDRKGGGRASRRSVDPAGGSGLVSPMPRYVYHREPARWPRIRPIPGRTASRTRLDLDDTPQSSTWSLTGVEQPRAGLEALTVLLGRLERASFSCARLRQLQAELDTGGHRALRCLACLRRLRSRAPLASMVFWADTLAAGRGRLAPVLGRSARLLAGGPWRIRGFVRWRHMRSRIPPIPSPRSMRTTLLRRGRPRSSPFAALAACGMMCVWTVSRAS